MQLALETVRLYDVKHISHVEVCYPSWMYPGDVNASILSYDGAKLVFEIGRGFCIRLNKDNNLFFKVVGEQFMLIDPTTVKAGSCFSLKTASHTEYKRHILDNLFPKANLDNHEFYEKARGEYGPLFTSFLNPRMLFVERPEDEEYPDSIVVAQGDYVYDVINNTIYYPPEKMEEVDRTHRRLNALYGSVIPVKPLYLNAVLENFE